MPVYFLEGREAITPMQNRQKIMVWIGFNIARCSPSTNPSIKSNRVATSTTIRPIEAIVYNISFLLGICRYYPIVLRSITKSILWLKYIGLIMPFNTLQLFFPRHLIYDPGWDIFR